MLRQLMTVFNDQLTTDPNVYCQEQYSVYRLEDGLCFGIKATAISDREQQLLDVFAERIITTSRSDIDLWRERIQSAHASKISRSDLSTFCSIQPMNGQVKKFNNCSPLSFRRRASLFLLAHTASRSLNAKSLSSSPNYPIYF